MTVKTSISLTDRHHAFADKKAKEGQHSSISGVVAAGIERLMEDEEDRNAALSAMGDAIRERAHTPREQWIDGVDDLFDEARELLRKK